MHGTYMYFDLTYLMGYLTEFEQLRTNVIERKVLAQLFVVDREGLLCEERLRARHVAEGEFCCGRRRVARVFCEELSVSLQVQIPLRSQFFCEVCQQAADAFRSLRDQIVQFVCGVRWKTQEFCALDNNAIV